MGLLENGCTSSSYRSVVKASLVVSQPSLISNVSSDKARSLHECRWVTRRASKSELCPHECMHKWAPESAPTKTPTRAPTRLPTRLILPVFSPSRAECRKALTKCRPKVFMEVPTKICTRVVGVRLFCFQLFYSSTRRAFRWKGVRVWFKKP